MKKSAKLVDKKACDQTTDRMFDVLNMPMPEALELATTLLQTCMAKNKTDALQHIFDSEKLDSFYCDFASELMCYYDEMDDILSFTLRKQSEATMIFQEHPDAFEIWRKSGFKLRIFKSNGEPLVTFHSVYEVFDNMAVRSHYKKVNEELENPHPWMPVGLMIACGVADWHDDTDPYMTENFHPRMIRLVEAAPSTLISNTEEKSAADPISSQTQVSDQRVEEVS